jgi:hypothetical protein
MDSKPESSFHSLGGHARRDALTPAERSEIASQAAAARWNLPKATHEGDLKIGDHVIHCAVLEDGRRVLTQSDFMRALGRARQAKGRDYYDGDVNLPAFLTAKNLKPFIPADLYVTSSQIEFKPLKGAKAFGYSAELLPAVCEVFLAARDAGPGVLAHTQLHVLKQADILMRGLARVGITALVDEATGYQEVRDRVALQKILDRYLTDEWAKWSRLFEPEFYQHLFRLKGVSLQVTPDGRKPQYVGKWTNEIVYSRLAPGIREHLRKVNPRNASGGKARKDHQHFTRDYGHPALKELLSNEIFLMKTCSNYEEFKRKLDMVAPKMGDTMPLQLDA